MRQITCLICNNEFIAKFNHQFFCSKECWKRHDHNLNRTVRLDKRKQSQKKWWKENGVEYCKQYRKKRGKLLRDRQNKNKKVWYQKNKDKICEQSRNKRKELRMHKKDPRSKALSLGFKSMFEVNVRKLLPKWVKYEADTIHFTQPAKARKYLPDFKIKDNVYIEAKGRLTLQERQKHLWIKEQHPNVTIYFLFANAFNRITKRSKTTYADWCEANGFEWADFKMGIPKHWVTK